MKKKFESKVVWITGGGSGLGKALAIQFARNGAKVIISGRRKNKLDEALQEIEKENTQGLAIKCDVAKEEDIVNAVSQIINSYGRLDVAIANAAIPITGKIEELKHEVQIPAQLTPFRQLKLSRLWVVNLADLCSLF